MLMAFCIFSVYPVAQPGHNAQVFDNILNAYMRGMWACAVGWMIFACVQGYGGMYIFKSNIYLVWLRIFSSFFYLHLAFEVETFLFTYEQVKNKLKNEIK